MQKLILYHFPTCPFCVRVLNFIAQNDIKLIELRDISANISFNKELFKLTGRGQVPVLFIDGTPLYESLDIIYWIEKNILDQQ